MLDRQTRKAGQSLADFLNGETIATAAAISKVTNLLESMQAVQSVEREQQFPLLNGVYEQLSAYPGEIWPEVVLSSGRWVIRWIPRRSFRGSGDIGKEWDAVESALLIARNGHLLQLKKCGWCSKWIFAVRHDQRWCPRPSRCRQNWYEASPKEHRRRNEARQNNRGPAKAAANAKAKRGKTKHGAK